MSTVIWKPELTLALDPQSIRDFNHDFTKFLEGEVITNVVITPTNCTATVLSNTATAVKTRVSNVTASASVKLRLTMASGQAEEFTINFIPEDH